MSEFRNKRCRNKRNHNCSPCPYCDIAEHDYDHTGICRVCGVDSDASKYEGMVGGFERIKGRVMKRRFDDEDDYR